MEKTVINDPINVVVTVPPVINELTNIVIGATGDFPGFDIYRISWEGELGGVWLKAVSESDIMVDAYRNYRLYQSGVSVFPGWLNELINSFDDITLDLVDNLAYLVFELLSIDGSTIESYRDKEHSRTNMRIMVPVRRGVFIGIYIFHTPYDE